MDWKRLLHSDIPTAFRAGRAPHLKRDASRSAWKGPIYWRAQRQNNELSQITTLLRAIVRTNAPLVPGLEAAFYDVPSLKLRHVLAAVHFDLLRGASLSEAMQALPRFFPRYYVDVVQAAECTGTLPEAFAHLAQHIAERIAFRRVIVNYLAYAGTVGLICLGLAFFVVTAVFPQFTELMSDFGIAQPPVIERLRWAFDLRTRDGWAILIIAFLDTVIALRLACVATRRFPALRRLVQAVWLRIPVMGNAYGKAHLAHASAVLETLLEGGVTLDAALDSAASSDIALVYAKALQRMRQRVREGASLTQAMAKESVLPRSFKAFVSVGEGSGRLAEAFGRVAQLYRRQAQKRARVLLDVVSPAAIVIIGLLVCAVAMSVFLFNVTLADAMMATM